MKLDAERTTRMLSRSIIFSARAVITAAALSGFVPFTHAAAATGNSAHELLASEAAAALQRTLDADVSFAQIRALYTDRGCEPIWSGSPEALERARAAKAMLVHADEQGLNAVDYESGGVSALFTRQDAAAADLDLTRKTLAYMRDVRGGRLSPNAIYRDVGLPEAKFDPVVELSAALRGGSLSGFLAALPPPHPEYRRLVPALAYYRNLSASGGWPSISAESEIRIGSDDSRLSLLRERLAAEDQEFAALPQPNDDDVFVALKRYQTPNGLDPDGRAGRVTLEAMNVSASTRVEQILANMERWRWLPRTLERRYIAVNAADQSLGLIEDGKVVLTSRVIVGRPQSPTPIMRAEAVAVTANPPWNVPPLIAVREILPKLKRNPNYLVSENMILLNGPAGDPHGVHVDWQEIGAKTFPYRIRQVPGEKNALGLLKLELPNKFDVYLHDTPGKSAFQRNDRALSHGCIRVQGVLPLAVRTLGGDEAETLSKLEGAIASGKTQQFRLEKPLPVYVLYWTAMAESDGTVAFRRDLYGRDRRLTDALANRVIATRMALLTGSCSNAG